MAQLNFTLRQHGPNLVMTLGHRALFCAIWSAIGPYQIHWDAIITLPMTTSDIGELLNSYHKREKVMARSMLRVILSSVQFLVRQGLTLRGNNSDSESNLLQLLKLRTEDCPHGYKGID